MMQANNKSRQRLLALGVLLIAMLAFFLLVIEPYLYVLKQSDEHLDSVKFEHFNNQKLLHKRDYYIDNLEILEDAYDGESVYLQSEKRSLAAAEVQEIFKSFVDDSNAELISTQVTTDDDDVHNSVGLRARLRADIFALQKLIYAVETGSPRLVINDISVRRSGRAIFRYNKEESSSQTLDVTMYVFGYVNAL